MVWFPWGAEAEKKKVRPDSKRSIGSRDKTTDFILGKQKAFEVR